MNEPEQKRTEYRTKVREDMHKHFKRSFEVENEKGRVKIMLQTQIYNKKHKINLEQHVIEFYLHKIQTINKSICFVQR